MGIPTSARRMVKYGTRECGFIGVLLPLAMVSVLLLSPFIIYRKIRGVNGEYQPKSYTREEIKEMDKKFFSVLGIIVLVFLILVGIGFLAQYGLI